MTRLGLSVVGLSCLLVSVDAQQPTFSTRRENVRVDVLITERGRPVRDLKVDDFEILDSGVPQRIDFVSFEQTPLNVVLALDNSTSITAERLAHLREASHAVLASLTSEDQAALLTFTDAVTLRNGLTSNVGTVRAELNLIQPAPLSSGGTALVDACYVAMTVTDADMGRGILIAFTDGVDTSSWLPADRVLQTARRSNVVAYAASTSAVPKGSFLRDVTEVTGGSAIEIASTADLRTTFLRILDEFRQRYLVSYSPLGVPNDGWHPLTVRVKNRRVDIRARPGYFR